MNHREHAEALIVEAVKWEDDADECRRRGMVAVVKSGDRRADREHLAGARESDRKARRCREHALMHATLAANEPLEVMATEETWQPTDVKGAVYARGLIRDARAVVRELRGDGPPPDSEEPANIIESLANLAANVFGGDVVVSAKDPGSAS